MLFQGTYDVTPSNAFLEIDLSGENVVVSSGWVRVGFEIPSSDLGVGSDDGGVTPGRNLVQVVSPSTEWVPAEDLSAAGDWVIRLLIGTEQPVFSDGFESGDLSAWSLRHEVVPP